MDKNFEDIANLLEGIVDREITLQEFVRSILWGVVKDNPQSEIRFNMVDFVSAIGIVVKYDQVVSKIFCKFEVFFARDLYGYYSDDISQQLANIEGIKFNFSGLVIGSYYGDDENNFQKVKKFFEANENLKIFEEIIKKMKKILL